MISLGQRMMCENQARDIVRVWLDTPYEGRRHVRRFQMIDEENKSKANGH